MPSELIAGDEAMTSFALRVFHLPDPLIGIWVSEEHPDSEEVKEAFKKYGIDFVHFFIKEQLHSLFFPNGFQLDEWNLVLVGVKEDMNVIQPPTTGVLRGWMMGFDVEKMTLNFDLE